MWQGWVDMIVGVWLILCGFVPGLQTSWSMLLAGFAVGVIGFSARTWQGNLNGLSGIWLFLSAVWFGLVAPWNFFLFGAIITVLAVWNVSQHPHPEHLPAH